MDSIYTANKAIKALHNKTIYNGRVKIIIEYSKYSEISSSNPGKSDF